MQHAACSMQGIESEWGQRIRQRMQRRIGKRMHQRDEDADAAEGRR
jgi:hypothetical protein